MKKRVRRGQSSVEFLMVTGIGLFLITTVSVLYLNYAKGSEDQTRIQQVTDIGQTILKQVSTVNAWGGNSWVMVDAVMPDNVIAIYTVENNTIVFDISTSRGVVSQPVFSTVPVIGVTTVGTKTYVTKPPLSTHAGATRFQITSLGTQVQIEAIS